MRIDPEGNAHIDTNWIEGAKNGSWERLEIEIARNGDITIQKVAQSGFQRILSFVLDGVTKGAASNYFKQKGVCIQIAEGTKGLTTDKVEQMLNSTRGENLLRQVEESELKTLWNACIDELQEFEKGALHTKTAEIAHLTFENVSAKDNQKRLSPINRGPGVLAVGEKLPHPIDEALNTVLIDLSQVLKEALAIKEKANVESSVLVEPELVYIEDLINHIKEEIKKDSAIEKQAWIALAKTYIAHFREEYAKSSPPQPIVEKVVERAVNRVAVIQERVRGMRKDSSIGEDPQIMAQLSVIDQLFKENLLEAPPLKTEAIMQWLKEIHQTIDSLDAFLSGRREES